jgi:glycosyltransferase involved in cell wall biosynthesis
MKLVAILRIKDQIQTIDECMQKLSSIVDEILVVDNGSTDGTFERYKNYPKIIKIFKTEGYDEGRDKILLLEESKKLNPDWIMWLDADEIFEKHFNREVADEYMNSSYDRIMFRMCNFWLGKERCIYDGQYYLYNLHPQRSMWRNLPEAYFKDQKLHNGDIRGIKGPTHLSPYRVKHYGYIDRDKMQEKLDRYLKEDTSGTRDYRKFNDPNLPRKTYKFYEFDNATLNLIYIIFYKYICNLLWYLLRIKRKLWNY